MWVRFTLIGCCLFALVPMASANTGTTRNIKDIFTGRCLQYWEIGPAVRIEPSVKNCTELWSIFSKAWTYKNPTTVTEMDYNSFFGAVKQQDIEKILLWSGTYVIAHEYSSYVSPYRTLEDSFMGYLVNGLTWCGMECSNCTGINYDTCPDFQHNNATGAFWGGASRTFATSLKKNGSVQVMLNGSSPHRPAFRPDSFFGKVELPNLPKSAKIGVILVHDIGKPVIERCNSGSLLVLRYSTEEYGFQFHCVENPPAVLHLLCADKPQNKECFINVASSASSPVILFSLYYFVSLFC